MSGETKVADVAAQLQQKIPVNRGSFMKFFEWYHKTYIKAGRINPIVHAALGIGILGYAIEYPHLKHEQEEAKKKNTEI